MFVIIWLVFWAVLGTPAVIAWNGWFISLIIAIVASLWHGGWWFRHR